MTAPFVSHRGLHHHSVKESHDHRQSRKLLRKLLGGINAIGKHITGFKPDDQSTNFDGVKSADTALVGDNNDHSVEA